jgi:hypothetical protein
MTDAAESDSDYESDLDVDLTDTDTDEEINIDEAVPANRGPWISVVDPGTFDLPEPRFHVKTGPVIFAPNSST